MKLYHALVVLILLLGAGWDWAADPPADETSGPRRAPRVLLEASKDGGVWSFPQGKSGFDPNQPHQGKAVADLIRNRGYEVVELGRGEVITEQRLRSFDFVVRPRCFPAYAPEEVKAYAAAVSAGVRLILFGQLHANSPDFIADGFGFRFADTQQMARIETLVDHAITKEAAKLDGPWSTLVKTPGESVALAWINKNEVGANPVMGYCRYGKGDIVFLGTTIPQREHVTTVADILDVLRGIPAERLAAILRAARITSPEVTRPAPRSETGQEKARTERKKAGQKNALAEIKRNRGVELDPEQEKAIAEIKKVGGMVSVSRDTAGKRTLLVSFYSHPGVSDADLVHFEGLTDLSVLGLFQPRITDVGLEHLKGLNNLQELFLDGTQVTDKGLEHLKGLTKLSSLSLYNTRVTGAGLEHLTGLANLSHLNLSCTQATGAGLEHLKGLTVLDLSATQVGDAGIEHLKDLTSLSRLNLSSTRVSDAGLEHLKKLSNLSALNLADTKLTVAAIEKLTEALPNLSVTAGREGRQYLGAAVPGGTEVSGIRFIDLKRVGVRPGHRLVPPEKDHERIGELKGTPLYDNATGGLARDVLSAWGAAKGPHASLKFTCWALSPDGKLVAIGAGYVGRSGKEGESFGAISVCEVSTGRRVAEYSSGGRLSVLIGFVEYVAFNQDGKTVYYRAQPFELDGK